MPGNTEAQCSQYWSHTPKRTNQTNVHSNIQETHISETVLPSQNIALVKMNSTQALMESKVNLLGLFHSSYALSGCCHALSKTRLGRHRQRYHLRIGHAAWGSKWSDGVVVKNLAPKNQI